MYKNISDEIGYIRILTFTDTTPNEIKEAFNNLKDIKERSYNVFLNKIGVAFQYGALLASMTLEENITLPIMEHKKIDESVAQDIARWKLSLVDLNGYEKYYPSDISGGMKKEHQLPELLH